MNNCARIEAYKELIKAELLPLIDSDYVLLDVPNHGNIGDNLIWEGELEFLKNIPYECIYSANVHNWDEAKIQDAKIILFHGGGNWGDLYRECQEHRLYITEKYKDKRIIVFPQTVWYNDMSLLVPDCNVFNKHRDIHICVRDQKSMELLSGKIDKDKLHLLPDMAFFINIDKISVDTNKVLFLLRTDTEIDKPSYEIDQEFDVKDWPTFSNNKYLSYLQTLLLYIKTKLSKRMQRVKFLSKFVDPIYGLNRRGGRERYVAKGIRFFSNYDTIYTTRLHGLILGVLMGKKMIIVDNKYNKCKNFYDTWLHDFSDIEVLSNL